MRNLIVTMFTISLMIGIDSEASEYYKVQVTRKGQDIYQIDGKSIYVKTRHCYEYSYSADAIIKVDSYSGYIIGEIIFVGDSGDKCDIETIIK